jgi:selenocysteine-specific elongation factor
VHFHAFTSETIATISLYQRKELQPEQECFAQLKLAAPVLLVAGDRFIIRQFSPVVTIAGGVVLENDPAAKVKGVDTRRDFLHLLADPSRATQLRARVMARGANGLSLAEATARTGWARHELLLLAAQLPDTTTIGEILVHDLALQAAQKGLVRVVESFHRQNPLVQGMNKEALREQLNAVAPDLFAKMLDDAVKAKQMEITGELVHLAGRGVVMKNEETESRRIIEEAFSSAGLKVPALKDVLTGLKIDKPRAQQIVTLLLREKTLVKISDELVFHRDALIELRRILARRKAGSARINVGQFKEMTGVSRKYAIPLLEYLDRERVTRRVGDERIIL